MPEKNLFITRYKSLLKLPLVILILMFLQIKLNAQARTVKVWDKNNPISWSDYLGKADTSQQFDAYATSGDTILYKWHIVNSKITIEFSGYALMDMGRSWVKEKGETQALLRHEQLHFDISEFFSRVLLKTLAKYQFSENFRDRIFLITHEAGRERELMQKTYDLQTKHSKNTQMQKKWELYMDDLLSNDYSLQEALSKEPTSTIH